MGKLIEEQTIEIRITVHADRRDTEEALPDVVNAIAFMMDRMYSRVAVGIDYRTTQGRVDGGWTYVS